MFYITLLVIMMAVYISLCNQNTGNSSQNKVGQKKVVCILIAAYGVLANESLLGIMSVDCVGHFKESCQRF